MQGLALGALLRAGFGLAGGWRAESSRRGAPLCLLSLSKGGISPARGEIAHYRFRQFSNLAIGESGDTSISPLAGECRPSTSSGGRGSLAPNLRILCPRAAKTRTDSAAEKNTSVANQSLITFSNIFHPPPPHIHHTVGAALMGPDDHRHSGERAAYGGGRRRRRTLGGDPKPCPSWPSRALKRSAPCASPGKKPYQGVWRATPDYRLVPSGRTARPGLP